MLQVSPLRLAHPLPADMLRREREHERSCSGAGDLVLDLRFVPRELAAEAAGELIDARAILDEAHAAEDDHAAEVQRPVPLMADALVDHAERRLVAAAQGVELVPRHAAVEVQPAILLAVVVVKRHSVGIAAVAQHGEHTALLGFQQRDTLRLGERLPRARKLAEPHLSPYSPASFFHVGSERSMVSWVTQ